MLNPTLAEQVDKAVASGTEALFARQRPGGVFAPGPDRRSSPANTAVALIALHLAEQADGQDPDRHVDNGRTDDGRTDDGLVERGITRLCETQREDGGWAMPGVPTEVLSTAVVTDALQLIAPERAASAIRAGRERLAALGGPLALAEPAMTGLIRQFDALAGHGDEAELPRLPLELLLLPVLSRRLLSLRLPIFASMALGQAARRRQGPLRRRLNALARPAALSVVRQAYEREGSTGGFSADPWLTSLICIGVTRSGLAPDIARAAARRLRSMARPDGSWDLMELDITWSGFATSALLEAGLADDPRLTETRAMFHERQQNTPFTALGCPGGFWGFSSARSWPMALETAEISSALLRLPGGEGDDHVRRGIAWLTSVQDSAGSWSLAVRDSRPGGFGPCPYMTAKAVDALLDSGAGRDDPRVTRAVRWLLARQAPDGSFEALWYRGRTPGTAVVLETLCRTVGATHPAAERARERLVDTQRDDGSWGTGEDTEPGTGDNGGPGTTEETAWALHALLAAGLGPGDRTVEAAARRLAGTQRPDGGWAGAPVNEYIRFCYRYADDQIASGLAVRALARLRTAATRDPEGAAA
ncbi:prenyltransferase/squalene oxidase repeat-containing protein [Streptomyces sp. NPDC088116]|uniref:prenyltransferase/squalene oxidase repeat-containing protein n=1 Tax=Streptomyces sp. NPDC088116 TaxID=3365825 RepID=UPI003819AA22